MNKVSKLKTSDGIEIEVSPYLIGSPVKGTSDGKLIQFRSDMLYPPAIGALHENLRCMWTVAFGAEEAESLLNQFKREYPVRG